MPYDLPGIDVEDALQAAFRVAHPDRPNPSKGDLREFAGRDFEAIMARLDVQIAESNAHLDRILSTLANRPS
jgi:hypothetical protein